MSDKLVIDQGKVTDLKKSFEKIKEIIDLEAGNSGVNPCRENIGHSRLIESIEAVNSSASSMTVKYQRKTKKYIDYLKTVLDESTKADNQMDDALTKGKEEVKTTKHEV